MVTQPLVTLILVFNTIYGGYDFTSIDPNRGSFFLVGAGSLGSDVIVYGTNTVLSLNAYLEGPNSDLVVGSGAGMDGNIEIDGTNCVAVAGDR